MTESSSFTIHLEQEQGFDFRVRFDWPDNPDLLPRASGTASR